MNSKSNSVSQQQPSGQAWANETGLRQIECPSCGELAVAYDPQHPTGEEWWQKRAEELLNAFSDKSKSEASGMKLTDPAAGVPEAMGDAEIDRLVAKHAPPIHPDFIEDDDHIELVRAVNAARDAHWQSTRLRGGVPDEVQQRLFTLLNGAAGDGLIINGIDAASLFCDLFPEYVKSLTAAPQAPAAEVDAGYTLGQIADACVQAEISDGKFESLSIALASMSAQAGKGGA